MEYSIFISLLVTIFQCTTIEGKERIIGGSAATAGQFPFSAAIYIQSNQGQYFCGGTIVSNRWILTAAQCCDGAISYTIQMGSVHLIESDTNRIRVTTTECVMQPTYNSTTLQSDVALIKLRLPITFNDYVNAVTLPTIDLPDTISGTAIGWGWTSDQSTSYSEELQQVSLAVVPYDDCVRTYGSVITSYTLCTEGNFNEGTCTGDSGGPFLVHLANGNTWQIGIASFLSYYGCEAAHPSGYTKVLPYLAWINSVIQEQY